MLQALSYDGAWPYVVALHQGGVIAPPSQTPTAQSLTTREMVVRGVNLGGDNVRGTTVLVRVGATACEASNWLSSSRYESCLLHVCQVSCVMSLTSQTGTRPPASPALWRKEQAAI